MWLVILIIMIFVNLGLSIIEKIINIYNFFQDKDMMKIKNNKSKLVE